MTYLAPQRSHPDQQVLLHELDHRIDNEFASAISAVSLAAARTNNDEVKGALSAIAKLLHHYADVHRSLRMPEYDTLVDAAAYLRQLCLSISRSMLEHRGIRLLLVVQPLRLESDTCWRLGMIVHELINNAARHACARERSEIRVELARVGAFVEFRVVDNGSAVVSAQPDRGLKIINELVESLEGQFEQRFVSRGSMFLVAFPLQPRQRGAVTRDSGAEMAEIAEPTF